MKLIDVIEFSKTQAKHPIQCLLAYATQENFLGRIVNGYHPNAKHLAFVTPKTAQALCVVQKELNQQQLGLFIFDGYRPLRAVKDFYAWMHAPVANEYELERKKIHYPYLEKNQLAGLGYVADTVSNHCFGDTVDLTLMDLNTQQLLNMGAVFDYFDEISHPSVSAEIIGEDAHRNRLILSDAMQRVGFKPYEKEFWHFTFHEREVHEPMDDEIKATYR